MAERTYLDYCGDAEPVMGPAIAAQSLILNLRAYGISRHLNYLHGALEACEIVLASGNVSLFQGKSPAFRLIFLGATERPDLPIETQERIDAVCEKLHEADPSSNAIPRLYALRMR